MKLSKRKKWILGISITILFFSGLIFLWQYPVYKTLLPGYHSVIYTPTKYKKLLEENKGELESLKLIASSDEAKNQKLHSLFIKQLTHIYPYWYGTRWNFNGTTEVPGQGSIACGYFVTTVLQQAGLKINRSALAQLGSEQMILSICNKENIYRFTNYSMWPFINTIKSNGVGIYLIGLDNHTGFIWNDGSEIYFVHASGRFPYCVKKEKAIESITLWKSKYKVIADISSDTTVLNKWLFAQSF